MKSSYILVGLALIATSVWAIAPNVPGLAERPAAAVYDIAVSSSDLVRVYDGDTFFIDIEGVHPVFGDSIGVRIKGIDTPELRSGCVTKAQKMNERRAAIAAKVILERQLKHGNVITLHNIERDKYFRLLADVSVDGTDVTTKLLDAGLAVPYDGGTKSDWCATE